LGGLFEHILFVLREGCYGASSKGGKRRGGEGGVVPELELGGGNEGGAHPDLATLQ
jgi:hypothetical protein